jgi:hypothetical protein
MTVADKEGNMVSLIQKITEGWVLGFPLNWALCYKIEGII